MTGRLSDREIFLKAIDLTGDARRAFLDEACGDDVELRHRVERLLEVDARPSEASTTPYVSEPSRRRCSIRRTTPQVSATRSDSGPATSSMASRSSKHLVRAAWVSSISPSSSSR